MNDENFISPDFPPEKVRATRRVFSRLALIAALTLLVANAVAYLLAAFHVTIGNYALRLLLNALLQYVPGTLLCLLFLRGLPKTTLSREKLPVGTFFLLLLVLIGGTQLASRVSDAFLSLFSSLTGIPVSDPVASLGIGMNPLFLFLFSVILAPIAEEFFFRKLLLDRVAPYGSGLAIVVSGLLFGLYHGNFSQMLYTFTLGAVLAYVYLRTGNILHTILLHASFNFVCGFLPLLFTSHLDLARLMEISDILINGGEIPADTWSILLPFLFTALYALLILGAAIAGIVIFCCNVRKIKLRAASDPLPRRQIGEIVFFNPGMISAVTFGVGLAVVQLFL